MKPADSHKSKLYPIESVRYKFNTMKHKAHNLFGLELHTQKVRVETRDKTHEYSGTITKIHVQYNSYTLRENKKSKIRQKLAVIKIAIVRFVKLINKS